jgi:hypothetical protein
MSSDSKVLLSSIFNVVVTNSSVEISLEFSLIPASISTFDSSY